MALETTSHRRINKASVSAGTTAEPSRSGVRFAKLSLVGRGYSFRFAFAPVENKWDSPADHDGSVAVSATLSLWSPNPRESWLSPSQFVVTVSLPQKPLIFSIEFSFFEIALPRVRLDHAVRFIINNSGSRDFLSACVFHKL
jgi:hypothetical protein